MARHEVAAVDPFDLPEWLGVRTVTWTAETRLEGPVVRGRLEDTGEAGGRLADVGGAGGAADPLGCDVLACDLAHPVPVLADTWRTPAHQAWFLGEVLLVDYDGRLTLAVPGSAVTVEAALEGVRRLARAVGASGSRYAVHLRL
jgi:hypothetical protein